MEEIESLSSDGGSEHKVYLDAVEGVVFRKTINDSYGFSYKSPAQYLKRLVDYATLFPEIEMALIGVSKNERGNGVVWTRQNFVEGGS